MLSWWQGLILGLVQGLTEFLPISSSGHLVLAERWVGYRPQGVFFEVMVHLATMISVIVAYRARIVELLRDFLLLKRPAWAYAGLLLLASVPAAVVGVVFKEYFERTFHSMPALGWQFLITSGILWSTRFALPRATGSSVTPVQAVLIGMAQAAAIIPAISRSGATIASAMWSRLGVEPAAEFSFLMSLIVIAGSGVLEFRHLPAGTVLYSPGIAWAFVAAMVSGIFAIRFLVGLLRNQRFHIFAPYCAAVGAFCLVWYGWLGK
jgi:undecaprenyl-diphosphatase